LYSSALLQRYRMRLFMVFLCLTISMVACKGDGGTGFAEVPFQETIEIKGTLRFISMEGGFYGVFGDDGQRYDPLNLASAFQVDGLRVRIRAHIEKGAATTRMWGKIIRILKIKKLE
jgi:hypothetical protein